MITQQYLMMKSNVIDSKIRLFCWLNYLRSTIVDGSFDVIMTHVENQIIKIHQYLKIFEIQSKFLSKNNKKERYRIVSQKIDNIQIRIQKNLHDKCIRNLISISASLDVLRENVLIPILNKSKIIFTSQMNLLIANFRGIQLKDISNLFQLPIQWDTLKEKGLSLIVNLQNLSSEQIFNLRILFNQLCELSKSIQKSSKQLYESSKLLIKNRKKDIHVAIEEIHDKIVQKNNEKLNKLKNQSMISIIESEFLFYEESEIVNDSQNLQDNSYSYVEKEIEQNEDIQDNKLLDNININNQSEIIQEKYLNNGQQNHIEQNEVQDHSLINQIDLNVEKDKQIKENEQQPKKKKNKSKNK